MVSGGRGAGGPAIGAAPGGGGSSMAVPRGGGPASRGGGGARPKALGAVLRRAARVLRGGPGTRAISVPMVISAAVRSSLLEATALEATGIMTTPITTTTLIAGSLASCAAAIAVCGFAIDHTKLYDRKTPIMAANLLNDRMLPFSRTSMSSSCAC
jgi:hypothetical protein